MNTSHKNSQDNLSPSWLLGVDLCANATERLVTETEDVVTRIQEFVKCFATRYISVLNCEEFDLLVNDMYQFTLMADKFVKRIRLGGDPKRVDVGNMVREYVDEVLSLMVKYAKTLDWRQLLVDEGDRALIRVPFEYLQKLPVAVKTVYDNYRPETCRGHYSSIRQLGLQMALIRANGLKEKCETSQPIDNWNQLLNWLQSTDDTSTGSSRIDRGSFLKQQTNCEQSTALLDECEKRISTICECLENYRKHMLLFTTAHFSVGSRWLRLLEGTLPSMDVAGGYTDFLLRLCLIRDESVVLMAQLEVRVVAKMREAAIEVRRIRRRGYRDSSAVEAVVLVCDELVQNGVALWFQVHLKWVRNTTNTSHTNASQTYAEIESTYRSSMSATRRAVACHAPSLLPYFSRHEGFSGDLVLQ